MLPDVHTANPVPLRPDHPDFQLLALLTEHWQTAAALAAQLGVDTDTLSQQAAHLQATGVPLHMATCGYRLEAGTPAPRLVKSTGSLGQPLYYCGTLGSTQDTLRAWAKAWPQQTPHGSLLLAERQTAGRGRQGRAWVTPKDMLALSLLLRSPDPKLLPFWPLAVGVALREACGVGLLKWPNDLVVEGRKLAGILLEADMRAGRVSQVIVGVGLNVHQAPEGAAYLREFRTVQRSAVLADFLLRLEHWLAQPPAAILARWRRDALLGVETSVNTMSGKVSGVALDVSDEGGLIVQTPTGKVTVQAGDVQMLGVREID